jgi:ABC-type multidrug transport system ATPase subunit
VTGVDFDEISAIGVSRHFGRRHAVSRVSFEAARGTILGLLGPNGAGKSTLLAILATLLKASSGEVRYGRLAASAGPRLRARIGVLGHDLFLYPELTALENLTLFAGLYGVAGPEAHARTALASAGLADRADDPVSSLSRGMRQRVALERALVHGPRLVLLDEPFTGLDDASTAALVARLGALREAGAIVVLATHDLDVAEGLLDRAIFLREGRVVESLARPEALRATYRSVMRR